MAIGKQVATSSDTRTHLDGQARGCKDCKPAADLSFVNCAACAAGASHRLTHP